jgi:hypothetical protein
VLAAVELLPLTHEILEVTWANRTFGCSPTNIIIQRSHTVLVFLCVWLISFHVMD